MKTYKIRKACMSDGAAIMQFIDNYWCKNHILAVNKEIFHWQYQDGSYLNFIIAEDLSTGQLLAILGFIKYGEMFDDDIMLALWKSNGAQYPFLGVELLQYLENISSQNISCNGINLKTTKDIYEFMGFRIGQLKHYYRLSDQKEYKVAKIVHKIILKMVPDSVEKRLLQIKSIELFETLFDKKACLEQEGIFPKKSMQYLKHRYFEHPVYDYQVFGISDNNFPIKAVLFARSIECNGARILRIIDFIGKIEELGYVSRAIDDILREGSYEYIDFMQDGIGDEIMQNAGFILNEADSGNIIPNYFEPYECSNINVWYATKHKKGFCIFRGDGDQDRPNSQ